MENKLEIEALKELKQSKWWEYLVAELNKDIDSLTESILDINSDSDPLMKSQRLQLLELVNLPDRLLSELSPVETIWQEI